MDYHQKVYTILSALISSRDLRFIDNNYFKELGMDAINIVDTVDKVIELKKADRDKMSDSDLKAKLSAKSIDELIDIIAKMYGEEDPSTYNFDEIINSGIHVIDTINNED